MHGMTFPENIRYNTLAIGILTVLLTMLPGAVTRRDGTIRDGWQFNNYLDDSGSILFSEAQSSCKVKKFSETKSFEF